MALAVDTNQVNKKSCSSCGIEVLALKVLELQVGSCNLDPSQRMETWLSIAVLKPYRLLDKW